jgi:hypothetical protein
MIDVPAKTGAERELWWTLMDLAERERHWTLIGARMVELHALERGRVPARLSLDADALADARIRDPNPVRHLAEILAADGFALAAPSAFGAAHTFVKGEVEIDVLAPEHLGDGSEQARITIPPAHTVEVPGGRQALTRSEVVRIRVGPREGVVPRPALLGAILVKARAVDLDDTPDNQRSDLALLLSMVDDADVLADQLVGAERSWIHRRSEMNDPEGLPWNGLDTPQVRRGISALRILGGFQLR